MAEKNTAFFAFSYRGADKELSETVRNILEHPKVGFTKIVTNEQDGQSDMYQQIVDRINGAKYFVALLAKQPHTNIPPTYVVSEIAWALSRNKVIAVLIEDGVEISETGLYFHKRLAYKRINRDTISDETTQDAIMDYLISIKENAEVTRPPAQYMFHEVKKHVSIFRNGYGLVRYRFTILSLTGDLKRVRHTIGLDESCKKDAVLPPLDQMLDRPQDGIMSGAPMLAVNAAKGGRFSTNQLTIIETESFNGGEIRHFHIEFPLKLRRGDVVTYDWIWGFPNMFPTQQEHFVDGFRKGEQPESRSTIRFTHPAEIIEMKVRFERGINVAEPPVVWQYDAQGSLLDEEETLKEDADAFGITYSKTFYTVFNQGHADMVWTVEP